MFGDNKSVVTSSTIPHSTLGKRWNALSYHRVREAIAGGWLRFEHIPGTENPADIFTKPLAWAQLKVFLEPLLMWKGDTADIPSGSSNPEGSVTSPGPETRVNESHELDETWIDVNRQGARRGARQSETGGNANAMTRTREEFRELWNNMYTVLEEDLGDDLPDSV